MRVSLRKILNVRKFASSPARLFLALILVLSTLFLQNFTKINKNFEARVVKVIDGDTLEILSENGRERVRIYGIDAPELRQEFGFKAKTYLQRLILNQKLNIYYKNKDRYGRIIASIRLKNEDIAKRLVDEGYAWAYWTKDYKQEQMRAKSLKKGLWRGKNPIEPSKWRKANK